MELIPYEEFRRLRLWQFCPPGTEIESLGSDGEYMGRTWSGEGIKGVDFLWQRKSGHQLACILLALQPKFCPSGVEQAILTAIHLPLKRGLTSAAVRRLLGKPAIRDSGSDWETIKFRCGRKWPYLVMADFGLGTGLRSLDIARLDTLPKDTLEA
jgi:hypothetical protein